MAAGTPTRFSPDPAYLDPALLPQPGTILPPPPPRTGSAATTLDGQIFLDTRAIRQQDPSRWALASRDARATGASLPVDFACALGMKPDPAREPGLFRLLDRSAFVIGQETKKAQQHFARKRPYLHNHQPICVARFTPLDRSPSYPSSGAALGWGAALILSELLPERSGAILARGRALAESQVVCGLDWFSDMQAAMLEAAGLTGLLHASPGFRADLQGARGELEAQRGEAASLPAASECAAEQAAELQPMPSQP